MHLQKYSNFVLLIYVMCMKLKLLRDNIFTHGFFGLCVEYKII